MTTDETKLIHSGHKPADYHGVVGTPIVRTSTILYENLAAYEEPKTEYRYGRYGTPLTQNFLSAICELEKAYKGVITSSGVSAITTALLSFLKTGDHVLVVDTIYPQTREFCDNVLSGMGVDVEYYAVGADLDALIKGSTVVIYMESPGSATFEVQDVPAIVKLAQDNNIVTMIDNTWASGVLFNPIEHGVNVSILSCTKYINGHSDSILGAVLADNEVHYKILRKYAIDLGVCGGSEEINLALRGLKTIRIRMKEAGERALKIAEWLEGRDEITRVYHPALPSHAHHDLWKRDYKGCNGLISILLKPAPKAAITAFCDGLKIFGIGSSWGGYESLIQPQYMHNYRSAVPWKEDGFLIRLQIGLENPEDLIQDIEQALKEFGAYL